MSKKLNTAKVIEHAHWIIPEASDNPEDAVLVSMTQREVAILSFSLLINSLLFPQLNQYIMPFSEKMLELGKAQGKLSGDIPGESPFYDDV